MQHREVLLLSLSPPSHSYLPCRLLFSLVSDLSFLFLLTKMCVMCFLIFLLILCRTLYTVYTPSHLALFFGISPDAGKDWRQEEKGMTEHEMVWQHHRLDGWSLSNLWERVMDSKTWCAAVRGVTENWTWLSDWTELNWRHILEIYLCQFIEISFILFNVYVVITLLLLLSDLSWCI